MSLKISGISVLMEFFIFPKSVELHISRNTEIPEIWNHVHRSMQPELILHRVNTSDFNSLDLRFKHHICSSHLADTSRRVQGSRGAKEISKLYV